MVKFCWQHSSILGANKGHCPVWASEISAQSGTFVTEFLEFVMYLSLSMYICGELFLLKCCYESTSELKFLMLKLDSALY